jgi:hypothetical protein
MTDLKPTPLALTDEQFSELMAVAKQLYACDRDAFLRAVADRFAGRSEIGAGEFGRALRQVLHDNHLKWALSRTPWSALA